MSLIERHPGLSLFALVAAIIIIAVVITYASRHESVCEDSVPSEYGCYFEGQTLVVIDRVAVCKCTEAE